MKIGIVGSRNSTIDNISIYIPNQCTEIVSGGALGIDRCARIYAQKNKIKLTEFLPQYDLYGKIAPIIRNKQIIEYSDEILAFWDGKSKGTFFVINHCNKVGKKCSVINI